MSASGKCYFCNNTAHKYIVDRYKDKPHGYGTMQTKEIPLCKNCYDKHIANPLKELKQTYEHQLAEVRLKGKEVTTVHVSNFKEMGAVLKAISPKVINITLDIDPEKYIWEMYYDWESIIAYVIADRPYEVILRLTPYLEKKLERLGVKKEEVRVRIRAKSS